MGPGNGTLATPRGTRGGGTWIAAALLFLALVQGVHGIVVLSATNDEVTHLPSGYTYWKTGDYRLNPQHPPLVKLAAALPLLVVGPELDLEQLDRSEEGEWVFGRDFLFGNDADELLLWGRLPVLLISLLGGWVVFAFGRRLFGEPAGLLALGLWVLDPTVAAHSRFVTMDVALATFSVATVYALWRTCEAGYTRRALAVTGALLGCALATKFSAVVLVPSIALIVAADLFARSRSPGSARDGPAAGRESRALVVALRAALWIGLPALLVVWATYGFHPDWTQYWNGLRSVNADHLPGYAFYLDGEFDTEGFPLYFLFAFLYKTPLTTLLLLAATVVSVFLRERKRWLDQLFLLVPAMTYFVATSLLADPLGVRYLMPVYPFLFLWIAQLARHVPVRAGRLALALVLVPYLAAALRIHPDQLAYFNLLAGGPIRGHLHLDDSNIDWGQDLERLARYVEREGIEELALVYPWIGSPRYHGIPFRNVTTEEWEIEPTPGVYAVSTHYLVRGELDHRTRGVNTDWLSRYEPIARIGYSFYLFEFP